MCTVLSQHGSKFKGHNGGEGGDVTTEVSEIVGLGKPGHSMRGHLTLLESDPHFYIARHQGYVRFAHVYYIVP